MCGSGFHPPESLEYPYRNGLIVRQPWHCRTNEAQLENGDCFNDGRALAYYEMLDIIQHELEANDEDLEEFGLETDVDQLYVI